METLILGLVISSGLCLLLFLMSLGALTNARAGTYRRWAVRFGIAGMVMALLAAIAVAF